MTLEASSRNSQATARERFIKKLFLGVPYYLVGMVVGKITAVTLHPFFFAQRPDQSICF